MNRLADGPDKIDASYQVNTCAPGELSQRELEACVAIIRKGDAVDPGSAERELPRVRVLAVARKGNQIVGVGAIKRVRRGYAADITSNSGVTFPVDTRELGYVAVDLAHRNRGLSLWIVEALLSHHRDRVFATTYSEPMKKILDRAGFAKKGKEWEGRKGRLSFWEKM